MIFLLPLKAFYSDKESSILHLTKIEKISLEQVHSIVGKLDLSESDVLSFEFAIQLDNSTEKLRSLTETLRNLITLIGR